MIRLDAAHLLMIEPRGAATAPVVDYITKLAAGAWAARETGDARYRGVHGCTGHGCTATSDNADHYLQVGGDRRLTNSLLVHYVACHRDEVPEDQILAIATLGRTAEPTAEQLTGRRDASTDGLKVYR